ncbi:MAG: flagellar assembly protein FliH [Gammaproteobacteria bacterium]|nr:flagellar assembly protein FliH [Gammaproteobacteria bacterium]
MGSQSQKIPKQDAGSAQKWNPPSMDGASDQVFKHQLASANQEAEQRAGMPTAEEMERWQQEARKEGYADGLKQAQAETDGIKQRLLQLINFLEAPLQAMNEEVEQQLHQLAVTLAQQLVRREIRSDPGEIIGLIRESLQLLPANSRKIRVHLHPDDAELLRNTLQMDQHEEEQSWQLLEDPTITRGGCQIKADKSVINLTLEKRLQALAASVLGDERLEEQDEPGTD